MVLHSLLESIWKVKRVPQEWKDASIVMLPKSGDLTKCNRQLAWNLPA